MCDIWQIRNPKSKALTFWQRHFSGILQRRLDDLIILNNMQESAKILNALSTDHSSLFCSFLNLSNISRGRGL